jgi:hypothetical protein
VRKEATRRLLVEKARAKEGAVRMELRVNGYDAALVELLKRVQGRANVVDIRSFLKARGLPKGEWKVGNRPALLSLVLAKALRPDEIQQVQSRAATLAALRCLLTYAHYLAHFICVCTCSKMLRA